MKKYVSVAALPAASHGKDARLGARGEGGCDRAFLSILKDFGGILLQLLEQFFLDLYVDLGPHGFPKRHDRALLLLKQHVLQNPIFGRGAGGRVG